MNSRQQTIARQVEISGVGLHTGARVKAVLLPADENSGIRFHCSDGATRRWIQASTRNVARHRWETGLRCGDIAVRTVEHLLSAAYGLRVDNLGVEVAGPELPALDGSAAGWCRLLAEAGIVAQEAHALERHVRRPMYFRAGQSRYLAIPARDFRVTAYISFPNTVVGRQMASVVLDPDSFPIDLAPARTFGFTEWEEDLKAKGLAGGVDRENALIFSASGLDRSQELRFPDEPVRHKILDLVGDLALLGTRLRGHILTLRPGHTGNAVMAQKLEGLEASAAR